jgi:hypothetical protein
MKEYLVLACSHVRTPWVLSPVVIVKAKRDIVSPRQNKIHEDVAVVIASSQI